MAQGVVGDRLRRNIQDERERRGWSRRVVNEHLGWSPSSTALLKIERGTRAVHPSELVALADLFGSSVDTLLGRRAGNTDLAWSVSRLSSNAQKMAGDVTAIAERVQVEWNEVAHHATASSPTGTIKRAAVAAIVALNGAARALRELGSEFPAGGIGTR